MLTTFCFLALDVHYFAGYYKAAIFIGPNLMGTKLIVKHCRYNKEASVFFEDENFHTSPLQTGLV